MDIKFKLDDKFEYTKAGDDYKLYVTRYGEPHGEHGENYITAMAYEIHRLREEIAEKDKLLEDIRIGNLQANLIPATWFNESEQKAKTLEKELTKLDEAVNRHGYDSRTSFIIWSHEAAQKIKDLEEKISDLELELAHEKAP